MINRQSIINVPIGISGISLGFLTVSTVWEGLGGTYIRHFANLFACICLGLIFMKLIFNPKKVKDELSNPIVGSLYFTSTMTLMSIANYLTRYNSLIAKSVWLSAIILHIVMFFSFTFFMKKNFEFKNVVPSWFVPGVGICASVVTGKPMGFDNLIKIIFYYSLVSFLVLLPILLYRVFIFREGIPQQAKMSLAIFAAPANLCLASYLGAFNPSYTIIGLLTPIAIISTIYVYTLLPKFLKQPFSLSFAALTFPLAIGVVAMQRYTTFLKLESSKWVNVFTQIYLVELIIATMVIGYVVYKTIEMVVENLQLKQLDVLKTRTFES